MSGKKFKYTDKSKEIEEAAEHNSFSYFKNTKIVNVFTEKNTSDESEKNLHEKNNALGTNVQSEKSDIKFYNKNINNLSSQKNNEIETNRKINEQPNSNTTENCNLPQNDFEINKQGNEPIKSSNEISSSERSELLTTVGKSCLETVVKVIFLK